MDSDKQLNRLKQDINSLLERNTTEINKIWQEIGYCDSKQDFQSKSEEITYNYTLQRYL